MGKLSRRAVIAGAGSAGVAAVAGSAAAADFVLTIARKYQSDVCTSGYLAVNGKVIAYTLELPWRGNRTDMSSIPEGRYGGVLRYDHHDAWRIELTGIPSRPNIQIHVGNFPQDSKGCILVGLGLGADSCSVQDSRAAYAALQTAFYGSANPVQSPDKTITVEVES